MIHESFIIIKRRNGISADVYDVMLLTMNRLGLDIALYFYGLATVNHPTHTRLAIGYITASTGRYSVLPKNKEKREVFHLPTRES